MSTRREFLVRTTAAGIAAASAMGAASAATARDRSRDKPADRREPAAAPQAGNNSYKATTLWNQRVKVRDGAEMAVDIVLPQGAGPFPFVMTRTPYGRSRSVARLLPYLEKGYGLALVDMRGRGDSDGTWSPFVKDVDDAYDVIEWVAAQPYCTGKIGMTGGSYDGLTQWWSAAGRPPHLACIVPQAVGAVRDSGDAPFEGTGVPTQYWLWWMTLVTGRTFQNGGAPSWEDQMPTLPLRTIDERLGTATSAWQTYVAGKIDYLSPDFAISEEQMAGINVPVLVGVGWWDDQATMTAWGALQKSKAAKQCRLLIGAWDHAGNAAPRPVLGGMDVSASVLDMPAYIERFMALHLKGETNEMARAKRCHIFQTGTQRWDDLDDWPHPGAKDVSLYFGSDGDARSLRGNGRLERGRSRGADSDRYVFDPNDPARDMTNMAVFAWSDPPLDNRFLLRRKDVLVYDTEPMTQPLSISGRVRHELFVSSDRVDTDLFIAICDVHPDGRSVALGGDCGLRLSYREQTAQPKLLKPGEVVQVHLEGHWLHHVVLPGHRLRVAISSSKYPFSARNGGNGKFWADDTVLLPQTNTLHHSAKLRSRVLLPVVELGVA